MTTFAIAKHLRKDLPPASVRWNGFPAYNFVGGHNDADSLPTSKLADLCHRIIEREGHTLATYGLNSGPLGYLPLREFLVGKLNKYAAIDCDAEQILLTSGSLQAMDLINQSMLVEGDTVIVEESNYGGAFSRFRRLGVNMIAIPVDQDGMLVDALATILDQWKASDSKPKFIYTIPTVHNPSGTIMSLARRKQLLALANEHDLPVFEDECYADLVWDGQRPPSLRALDDSGRVIHIGSFSKTIAPALRVGYVVADWEWLSHILALKTDAGSGALEQMLLAEYCSSEFDEHVLNLNKRLKAKLDVLTQAIDREFGSAASYEYPPGGIFLWLTLPDTVDTTQLATVALQEGVAINPGHEWSLESDAGRKLRLCFANPDAETLDAGIKKLAEICHREFGVPVYGANQKR